MQWPPNSSSLFNEHRSFSPSALGSVVFLRAFSLSFYIVCVFVNRSVIDAVWVVLFLECLRIQVEGKQLASKDSNANGLGECVDEDLHYRIVVQ